MFKIQYGIIKPAAVSGGKERQGTLLNRRKRRMVNKHKDHSAHKESLLNSGVLEYWSNGVTVRLSGCLQHSNTPQLHYAKANGIVNFVPLW